MADEPVGGTSGGLGAQPRFHEWRRCVTQEPELRSVMLGLRLCHMVVPCSSRVSVTFLRPRVSAFTYLRTQAIWGGFYFNLDN